MIAKNKETGRQLERRLITIGLNGVSLFFRRPEDQNRSSAPLPADAQKPPYKIPDKVQFNN